MDVNVLAIWISGASALIALTSFIWAICSARSSRKLAEAANNKADKANQLSTDANNLSKEALEISERTESRQTDSSNIHWERSWSAIGVYKLTNKGDDEALNVRFIIRFNDQEVRLDRDSVPGGGSVDFKFSEAEKHYWKDLEELERREEARKRSLTGIAPPFHRKHSISERIDWKTTTGKPASHEEYLPFIQLVDPGDF